MKKDEITLQDKEKYEAKFKDYDRRKEISMPYMGFHLDDPTLWAYEFFRNPMSRDDPFKAQIFQDLILNDKSKNILAVLCRQVGKSITVAVQAIHTAYFCPGSTVVIISATKEQAVELVFKMKQFFLNAKISFDVLMPSAKDKKTEIVIRSPGAKEKGVISRIISLPATDAARGYSADLAIIDEAAFLDHPKGGDYVFSSIVRPMVLRTKGKIMLCTTPNGAQGFVYELFNNPDWSVYHFDWRVCDDYSEESIGKLRRETEPLKFAAEYEAKFNSPQSAYFGYEFIRRCTSQDLGVPLPGGLVCGVDFGKINDRCVILLGYVKNPDASENERVVKVWKRIVKPIGTDYAQIMDELRDIKKVYNPSLFVFDATGVGEAPADIARNEGFNIDAVKFSIKTKQDIYGNLKVLMESGRLEFPGDKELVQQLTVFEYEYSKHGRGMMLHHPVGGHDDECDALALLAWGLTLNSRFYGAVIIPRAGSVIDAPEGSIFGFCKGCDDYVDFVDDKCPVCHYSL